MTLRRAAWILVGLAGVCLLLLAVWRLGGAVTPPNAPIKIGGPFQLVDQNGRAVDQGILKGKWSAVFFGYTYCPDVCPTTLQTLATAEQGLGARAKDFQVIFVTVDPVRDTPSQLKAYLSSDSFPKGAIGLTGRADQIAAVTRAYGVYFQKQGTGPDYSVNHSSAIYVMNPNGAYDSVIGAGLTPDQTRQAILRAMNGGSA
ncbi:MAG TPA: SCO family protein [Caulobacteraceae bacterium]|jgi:protein SCO1/2|nr:SCO family protein [Caulobacteraceae bacterium]